MNFIHPYVEIYTEPKELKKELGIGFYREVIWLFLKHLDNGLKLYQHRVNVRIHAEESAAETAQFASIFEYRLGVDVDAFKKKTEAQKRRALLELLRDAFVTLGEKYAWDLERIHHAYELSVKEEFQFAYQSPAKRSRNRKYLGCILIELNEGIATFSAEFRSLNGAWVKKTELLQTDEGNGSWHRYFRKFGWINNAQFGLTLLHGQLRIITSIHHNEVEYLIEPGDMNRADIQEFLDELRI
ncbi:MAG: hypothetical protein AAF587_10160 [Bacteroidota bacterium]